MSKTLPGAHFANGGSIEATRALWLNIGGRCLIPCKIPEPHGQMRTMKVWTKQRRLPLQIVWFLTGRGSWNSDHFSARSKPEASLGRRSI